MIFSLEALQADHGDCLLLHAGTPEKRKLVLIDGGPAGIYKRSLSKRLNELKQERAPGQDEALQIDLAMVSHIDADHVKGMADLGAALVELHDLKRQLPYDVHILWHNAFDDVLGNEADELRAAAVATLSEPVPGKRADEIRRAGLAIVASVPQGRDLRIQAKTLGWQVNAPFGGLIVLPKEGVSRISLDDETTLTVVCPHETQLEELRKEWDTWLAEHEQLVHEDGGAQTAKYEDDSPYNLSSIGVLAEAGGKRMLLTGDARGDHVLTGLDAVGAAKAGVTEVDILKLPHHGSIRNLDVDFFERIPATHYVISANGHDDNPDSATLEMIMAVRNDDDFTIHLTNRTNPKNDLGARLDAFLAAREKAGRKFGVVFRDPDELSLRIDLADPPS